MFNSTLFDKPDSTCSIDVLENAVKERHLEIVEFEYDLWMDSGDEIFDGLFYNLFPPGFIDRDRERAKQVIRDLLDIARSPVIRRNLDAIYCYVMYNMIDLWWDDSYLQATGPVPEALKNYLDQAEANKRSSQSPCNKNTSDITDSITDGTAIRNEGYDTDEEDLNVADAIRLWLTNKDFCLNDFEDTYDPDFLDETIAESVAVAYLSKKGIPDSFDADIVELIDLLPNDLYFSVTEKLKHDQQIIADEANRQTEKLWPEIKGFFNVLSHAEPSYVSSRDGAMEIIKIVKHWTENLGGWRTLQGDGTPLKERTIQNLFQLGAITYINSQNLDMSCETNIGVGQEDIKISRGKDKTIIELKLSSNKDCVHGYEHQLPRYAEAEQTDNMIFCVFDLGDPNMISKLIDLHNQAPENIVAPELVIIDAKPQKSASHLFVFTAR